MGAIIREVMTSFGAYGPGYSINDPEVDAMSAHYLEPRAAFFVVEDDRRVLGGGGIGPLAGADVDVCELRKMYFLPAAAGSAKECCAGASMPRANAATSAATSKR